MKTKPYGYHASDSTLRKNGVRIAKLTTPEGKVLTIADAKTITDALNLKTVTLLATALSHVLNDVADLDDEAREAFGGRKDVSVVRANKALERYYAEVASLNT